LHVLSSFQRTGSPGGYFPLVEPRARRHQANSPRIPNHQNPVNTFFRCLVRQHRHRTRLPGPQHPAPHVGGPRCFPVGSRATRARRTGLPATRRSRGTRSKCGPLTSHPGDDVALRGDAGAPGKTFELSEMRPGCQPLDFASSAGLPLDVVARPESPGVRVPVLSFPASQKPKSSVS